MKRFGKKIRRLHRLLIIATITSIMLLYIVNIGFDVSDVQGEQIPVEKTYQIIVIKPNDTLWDIAVAYKNDDYYTTQRFIDEVKMINDLNSDTIIAGRQLTIPIIIE